MALSDKPATKGEAKKILLISLDSPLYSKGSIHFGLGAESIAGHAQKVLGVTPKHIDLQIDHDLSYKRILTYIEEHTPWVIGISTKIGSLDDLCLVLEGIRIACLRQPDYRPKLLIGGVYATFASSDLLNTVISKLGSAHKQNIFIIRRQGEEPFVELIAQNFERPQDIENVLTAGSRNQDDSDLKRKKILKPLREISLPTLQTVPDVLKQNGVIWSEFSRGCASFCTFCSIAELRGGRTVDERDAADVVENFKRLSELGVTSVSFADDDFPISSPNAQLFANLMIQSGLHKKMSFSLSTRATNIVRPGESAIDSKGRIEDMSRLREAGLRDVFIGLESFSSPQQKRYGILLPGKSTNGEKKQADANELVVEVLSKLNITLVVGFISIDPLMTDVSELEENLLRLKESNMYKHVTNPLHVLRVQVGTAYEKLALRAGLIDESDKEDLVFYRSRYASEVVESISSVADQWNSRKGSTDYALKAIRFSSYSKDVEFKESQRMLEELRLMDLDFGLSLCRIGKNVRTKPVLNSQRFQCVSIQNEYLELFNRQISESVIHFETKRTETLSMWLEVEWVAENSELCGIIRDEIDQMSQEISRLSSYMIEQSVGALEVQNGLVA